MEFAKNLRPQRINCRAPFLANTKVEFLDNNSYLVDLCVILPVVDQDPLLPP